MFSVARQSSENTCIKSTARSSDFRKADRGISLPVGIATVICSPAGMGLPYFVIAQNYVMQQFGV